MMLLSFHGSVSEKDRLLTRVTAHELADDIGQGSYVPDDYPPVYCAVGCLARAPGDTSTDRSPACLAYTEEHGLWIVFSFYVELEVQWGIPIDLAGLADVIHESMPPHIARGWPRKFVEAIPVGVDLRRIDPSAYLSRPGEDGSADRSNKWARDVSEELTREMAALPVVSV